MEKKPKNLPDVSENERFFPKEWKESFFRRKFDPEKGGYTCPKCFNLFKGPNGFKNLEADHIIPYSKGGKTIWANMILLCKRCNIEKSNSIKSK
jgi:5-methylcytosine-specific restriction endonuclease McrA